MVTSEGEVDGGVEGSGETTLGEGGVVCKVRLDISEFFN
jgi:hypothetical protein